MAQNRPVPLLALAGAVPALWLAGCEPASPPPAAPEPAAPVSQTLAGVDLGQPLRALGTEPFWGVDITAAGLAYSGVDRPEQTAAHSGPAVRGTVAIWSGRTDQGNDLEVTLTETECSDGMSDRIYPLSARVRIGEETLIGCAASTAAIMSAGESGPVV